MYDVCISKMTRGCFNLQKSSYKSFKMEDISKSLRVSELENGCKDMTNKLDSRKLCLEFY